MIDDLVQEIVAALSASGMKAQIERFPDKPARERFTHPLAALWVSYDGSTYDRPEALDAPLQRRTMRFAVAVLTRSLAGDKSSGAYVEAAIEVLHGRALSHGTPLVLTRDEYVDHENGVWRYDITFESVVIAVPAHQGEVGPALTRVTLEGPLGETTEVVSDAA